MNFFYILKYRIKTILISIIPNNILDIGRFLKHKLLCNKECYAVYNLGVNSLLNNQKRVLFCYDMNAFIKPEEEWTHLGHTHAIECCAIIQSLISHGFCVDLINHTYMPDKIASKYDLILGLGPTWRKAIEKNPKAKRVLYLTEKLPFYSLAKEKERIDYLMKRHKIKEKIIRTGRFFIDNDLKDITGIVAMDRIGSSSADLFPKVPVWWIVPTALINNNFNLSQRNINKSKKNFLWFGSIGIVHKGLDLLFDVFSKHPELQLHVCGNSSEELIKFRNVIPSNVVFHGFVNVESVSFLRLMYTCAFDIFPSCSEGIATSVLTCMNHGLIPIVTEECCIESAGTIVGEVLQNFNVETIEKSVSKWSNTEDRILSEQMNKTIIYARKHFCIDNFIREFDIISTELFNLLQS